MINIGALFPPVIIDSDSALGITLKASRVSKNYLKLLIISIFFFSSVAFILMTQDQQLI